MRARYVPRKKKKKKSPFSIFSLKSLVQGAEPDYPLLFCVFGLLVFGWVMVYSASAMHAETRYQDQFFFLKRQVLWSLIGLVAFVMATNIPMSVWQNITKPFYLVTLVPLTMVLIIGPEIAGARRWLRFGSFSFQPSEVAKLAMILVIGDYMDRRQSRLKEFRRGLAPLFALVGMLLFLIFVEPDLGTPILMGGVLLMLLILGGARIKHLLLMGAASLPLVGLAIFLVRYRLDRFFAYLNPWADPYGSGYQLVQSLMAMGSGGFLGQGLGNSKIKLSHLPDAHTDFVFSVLGEEMGLLGTLGVAILFMFIVLRGLKIAQETKSCFSRIVAAGISQMIGFQALINMGVASGLLPTKGMPLPFLSFGGSSLVITLLSLGIVTRISKQTKSDNKGMM